MKKNFYLIFIFNNCTENILPQETKTSKGTKNLDDQYTLEEKENFIRDGGEIFSSYDEIMKTKLEEYLEEKNKLEFSKITENINAEFQKKNEEEKNKINSEYDKKFQEESKKIYDYFSEKIQSEQTNFLNLKKKNDETQNEYHRNKIDSLVREKDKKTNVLKINLEKERDEKIKELKESYQKKLSDEIESKKKYIETDSKNSKEENVENFNKKYKKGILSATISGLEKGDEYQNTLEKIIEKYIQQNNFFSLE